MPSQNSVFYKWGGGMAPDFPRIESAEDEFLVTEDGTQIIDAASGAAVTNLGHSVDGVGDVMANQAERLDYISLSHFTAKAPERLADHLTDLTPGDLNAAFFVTSGSEAVESAIKLARAYHRRRGRSDKSVVVSRWQSYHGATLGALSASGNTSRRVQYRPLLKDWPKISPAYPYRWEHDGSPEEAARAAARELESIIRQEGANTVAAFVAEPVSGASIPAAHPHPAYFEEVRRICDEYDVLFIADEVMTGFGRTGEMFATERFDVVPDMMALGKGLSGGFAPISATVVREDVAAEFHSETDGSFDHGHTFAGHPISAAVADHVLAKYNDDALAGGRRAGERLRSGLEPLDDHPIVGDVRRCGLMLGVEFVADRGTKAPFDSDMEVAKRVYNRALRDGVYVYPGGGSVDGVAGDHCMLTPPLTTSDESLDEIAATLVDAVDAVHEEVS